MLFFLFSFHFPPPPYFVFNHRWIKKHTLLACPKSTPRHHFCLRYVFPFLSTFVKFVTENRLRARMRATQHWLKGPATSNPSAGFSCGNEGRSEATWPRFTPCIGPQIPGMIKVYLGTFQEKKSYFYFNFCATKDDQY